MMLRSDARTLLATAACALSLAGCAAAGTTLRPGADAGAAAGAVTARENAEQARESAGMLPKPPPLVMMGSLAYRARIALPPGAVAVVELRDVAIPGPGGAGRVVAEQRIPLEGRQLPVPYSFHVERDRLLPAGRHELRGQVVVGDRVVWRSDPVPVDITIDRIDTGELLLRQP